MKIEWQPKAIQDLDAAFDYIFIDNPRAAVAVLQTIRSAAENLALHPQMGRDGRVPNTRELVIPRLPDVTAYRIEDETVLILRMLHTSRRWPDIST